jgi:hypothetical protein
MKCFKIFTLALLFICQLPIYAQFVLSGELRPRTEYRHGYKTLFNESADPAFFTSQRTRITGDYSIADAKFGFSIQDVRIWGDVPQSSVSDGHLAVYQAWGEYFISPKFSIRAGRQEINYDDGRIFGNSDWVQQGRSHDVFLLKYSQESVKLHVGLAYNQGTEQLSGNIYLVNNNYKTMQYAWVHKVYSNIGVSLLILNNGMQYTNPADTTYKTVYSQTIGSRVTGKFGQLGIASAVYYQTGKSSKNKALDALYGALNIDFQFLKSFGVVAGFEYLSGNSMLNPGSKEKAFTPFYASGHKFNGHMDYFYVGNHINSVGLKDYYIDFKYTHGPFSTYVTWHYFEAANDVVKATEPTLKLSSSLGIEADLGINYKLTDKFSVLAGYSHMLPTKTMEVLKGGSKEQSSNWAWVSLVFKPEFFKL